MTFSEKLKEIISSRNSLLCVGLDPDLDLLPDPLKADSDALYEFCAEIVRTTRHVAAAYKLNFAFFEVEGAKGWDVMARLLRTIPPNLLTIADAKRSDIGTSSKKYAEAILQRLNFDAVTVNPYMGKDSVQPFLQWPEKGAFILGLTSNPGSRDFQHLQINARPLYKKVVKEVLAWNRNDNCGLVVGATHPDDLEGVRNIAPKLPFLIPGVGAQGGSLKQAIKYGTDAEAGAALITVSRSILYKSSGYDFAEEAQKEAESLNQQINSFRTQKQSALLEI